MITAIRICNFKSLRDLSLELRNRNVLIGPNKSGKTSLLDACHFIFQAMTLGDITKPLDDRGGFASVFWKGKFRPPGSSSGVIEFEITGAVEEDEKKSFEFTYSLSLSGDVSGRVSISRETLDVTVKQSRRRLIDIQHGIGTAKRMDGTQLFANPSNRTKPAVSYDIPGWEAESVKRFITRWHFFDFIPQLAKTTSNSAVAVNSLDIYGGNLSSWLHTLQNNHPDEFHQITKVVMDAFPEIESLGTLVTQAGTTFLTLREKGLQSPVLLFQASNGELKFLMLVSLIYSPFAAPLFCIEEPENHLHPRLLSLLVEIANQRRTELKGQVSQVLVTTHSPYLVDLLEPEDIVLIEKREGETSCRRPASGDELKRLIRESETTLGRLWFSGSLGGV